MSETSPPKHKLNQFAFWQCDNSDEPEDGYWQLFDTLAEAVAECPDQDAEIYEVIFKRKGLYREKKGVVKLKEKVK